MTEKMDDLSSHLVPFHMAAFCRGRRFNPRTVGLVKALRHVDDCKKAVDAAEAALAGAETAVQEAVERMRAYMVETGEA